MSKFARAATATRVRTPSNTPDAVTHEGGPGYSRDPKSELFLLAVTNMVGENKFYESGKDRDARFESLAKQVIAEDPAWVGEFIPYLRNDLNMRSASLVLACLYARERLGKAAKEGAPSIRSVIHDAISRADEPAELLAYWIGQYGRVIPKPVKRGVADAVVDKYDEFTALKWDSDRATVRMGDVIELTHPTPADPVQSSLFRYLINDRHGRADEVDTILGRIGTRRRLEAMPVEQRRPYIESSMWPADATAAAVTWEWLSGWLQGPMDAKAWESVIPKMGYMALLRNLRNFDQAGISDEVRAQVVARLTDPKAVAGSRQLPIRFYNAYRAVTDAEGGGKHWQQPLAMALDLTLQNIPELPGRTLVMIDASGSMYSNWGGRRSVSKLFEVAALFGAAIGLRNDADVYAYDTRSVKIAVRQGNSVMYAIDAVARCGLGGGTATWQNVEANYRSHDRVIIVTDEQAHPGADHNVVPARIPVYTFNVAGYRYGHAPSHNEAKRYTFGGLTDAAFAAISALERGVDDLAGSAAVA